MTVTARELLDAMGERLALRLVAGARGVDRAVAVPRVQQPGLALAGFLPQLHPDRIQVLGNSEIAYLATLDADAARRAVRGVAQARAACFVVTNDAAPPMRGGVIQPDSVARRVVRAIERNDLYILTHPEQREILRRRAERIDAMFEPESWED